MTTTLKREIIRRIFNKFGVFIPPNQPFDLVENLLDKKFLLDQKLKFETETGEFNNPIWLGHTKVENGSVKVIIASLTEEVPEFVAIIQLDAFPPYALRISLDDEDAGAIHLMIESRWIDLSILLQAKLLVAIEGLSEIMTNWEPYKDHKHMYQILINYLKFDNDGEES